MTRDDIIAMAREAKAAEIGHKPPAFHFYLEDLERFAHLVAKHTMANTDPSSFMSWQEGYEAGATAEREACAKYVEECSLPDAYSEGCLPEIANEIRARGQQ